MGDLSDTSQDILGLFHIISPSQSPLFLQIILGDIKCISLEAHRHVWEAYVPQHIFCDRVRKAHLNSLFQADTLRDV